MRIAFSVHAEPKGKGRPRFTGRGRPYTPKTTVDYEREVRSVCQDHMRRHGLVTLEGPVSFKIVAFHRIPASAPKRRKAAMASGAIRPTSKPDASNIAKAVEDSLNRVAYADDSQIVELSVVRFYSETPRVDVIVETIGGEARDDDRAAPAESPSDRGAPDSGLYAARLGGPETR